EGKIGCPNMTPGKSTSFKAGETIDVGYWRNNHLGGFIRWSIAPLGKESKELFDTNAFYYTCRESGPTCLPKGSNTKYAGDSSGDNTISCGDKITLPDWLPVGDYVLQWTWFGVGSSYGNIGWSEPQFRSCADIKLTTAGTKSAAPSCPTFVGGDRVSTLTSQGNDKCFYFYTTDIVNSQYKGSNTDYEKNYKFGIPAPVEKCGGGSASAPASGSNSTAPASATKTPAPATTTKAPASPAATTKAPASPAATTKAPVDGEATNTPTSSAPKKTRAPRPSRTAKTPAPSTTPASDDADDDNTAGDSTPAPATKAPGCKVKSAK
ncbi:hypothetical protein Gpo141_00014432, partial [Globisporangium polare]